LTLDDNKTNFSKDLFAKKESDKEMVRPKQVSEEMK